MQPKQQAICLTLQDVLQKDWFYRHNNYVMNKLVSSNWAIDHSGATVHHFGRVWLFADSIDENLFRDNVIYFTSILARTFSSRVRSSFANDGEALIREIKEYSEQIYTSIVSKQQDLFKPATYDDMEDWIKKGIWTTIPSTR